MTTTSRTQPVRFSQHLGDVVRRHRTARRWTQQQLHAQVRADLSIRTLQAWEHGDRAMPVDRLVDIAHAFSVHPSVLIEEAYTAAFGTASVAVRINLAVLATTTAPGLVALRRWATVRIRQVRDEDTTPPFSAVALDCMATLCGFDRVDLRTALAQAGAT